MGPRKSKRTRQAEAPQEEPEAEVQTAVIVAEEVELVPEPAEYTQDELRHFAAPQPPPTADDKKVAAALVDKYKAPGNHAPAPRESPLEARQGRTLAHSRHP